MSASSSRKIIDNSCQKISRKHAALNVEAACATSALGRIGSAGVIAVRGVTGTGRQMMHHCDDDTLA